MRLTKHACRLFIAAGVAAGLVSCAALYKPSPEAPAWIPRILSHEEALQGFYPLFDGTSLDGWLPVNARPTIDDGSGSGILWLPPQEANGRIETLLTYENFELRFEYRYPGGASGGLGALGLVPERGSAPEWVEEFACDPHDAGPGSWRTFTYVREEPLPGEPHAGFLALAGGATGVELRRIRIMPLRGGAAWRPLFNGEDLSGWQTMGDAAWTVLPDGVLRVDGAPMTGRSSLRTTASFGDFELRFAFLPHANANSGVFFRASGGDPWPRSYEAQINNNDARWFTGAIYDQMPAHELRAFDNRWNYMRIRAKGPEISVVVNGKTVVDMVSTKHKDYPAGWIALQGHDPGSIVDFKNIELRSLQ